MISPLSVALIAILVFRLTNDPFLAGLPMAADQTGQAFSEENWDMIVAERRARLLWETSILCLMVASIAAIGIALWMICRALAGKARSTLLAITGGLAAIMVVFIWGNDISLEYTLEGVLRPTVG